MSGQDPKTPEEWQEAVNMADLALGIDSCVQYGLIISKAKFNLDRAQWILTEGAKRGYRPQPTETSVQQYLRPVRRGRPPKHR